MSGKKMIMMIMMMLMRILKNLQYVQAMRLFKDEPKWTPLNRAEELDANPHRKEYVTQFLN